MVLSPHDVTNQLHGQEKTVDGFPRKRNHEQAMLNEQVFHDGIDDVFARYVCVEAVRILHIREDAWYMPSGAVIFNILRWDMKDVNRMCGYKSWQLDILQNQR